MLTCQVREPRPIRRDAMAGTAGDRCGVKGQTVATGTGRSAVRDAGQGRPVAILVRAERGSGDSGAHGWSMGQVHRVPRRRMHGRRSAKMARRAGDA